MKITIGAFILQQLRTLSIDRIYGVPGDYNLALLELIEQEGELAFIGNCNELNASYAADGYARLKGAGALITTYGVGDLAALSGIAGAYAERMKKEPEKEPEKQAEKEAEKEAEKKTE